jgi:hypothetical protein
MFNLAYNFDFNMDLAWERLAGGLLAKKYHQFRELISRTH